MRIALLAAAAMIATPLVAQTTPPGANPGPGGSTDQSTMSTPPAGQATGMPNSSMTPPATDGTTPPPSASPAMSSDAMASPAPTDATGKLPWCRKGQYNACREHENAQGKGLSKN